MIRVLFLMRSLEIGGAERQLVELVKNMDHTRFDIQIVTFYDGGVLRPLIQNISGVQVISLGKTNRWDLISFSVKLLKVIKAYRPHVVQSFLDVPNSFNVLAGKLTGTKIILGASASFIDFSRYDWTAAMVYRTGAILSRFADLVIANSNAGKNYNIEHGYSARNITVIPNGINTKVYYPDKPSGKRLRSKWGIPENKLVIGIVGRIDPMKDHPNFLRAALIINNHLRDVYFVCVGDGPAAYREEMERFSAKLGLSNLVWAGAHNDMPVVYNAFDILVSSSYGEGLAVVLGEAMSCGLPCVVTDVGDSAFAVGETGLIVPRRNSELLAEAICKLLKLSEQERVLLGQKARSRILEHFSIEKMVSAYQAAFEAFAKE